MAEVPADDGWLSAWEAERVGRMTYVKRRTEFRLGRWTAKQALAAVGQIPVDGNSLARLEVRADPDGAPSPHLDGSPWPVSMSMTDRADWAVCVVSTSAVRLGCDLELVEPRSDLFIADYFTPMEREAISSAGADRDRMANLLWSAKESALKVLHTGLRRDTRSVEVTLAAGDGSAWAPLLIRDTHSGLDFPGWWHRFGDFLLTVAASSTIPPPEPLGGTERLRTATPSHGWWHSG
jgi:4'-phosphopantetheinyl transferase